MFKRMTLLLTIAASSLAATGDVNLDSIAFLWYVTPGINLDADRRAGTVLIVR